MSRKQSVVLAILRPLGFLHSAVAAPKALASSNMCNALTELSLALLEKHLSLAFRLPPAAAAPAKLKAGSNRSEYSRPAII
jgi:hypothetical protein